MMSSQTTPQPAPTPRRPVKPLTSLLVKPAGPDCNMGCKYCFYLEKAVLFPGQSVHRMSLPVLEEMVRQTMTDGAPNVSFGWQGGEPTLMGLDFFRQAVVFQKQYGQPGQTVGNGLQTNGVLIDDEWAKFLAENQFLVGLSLDGPQHIHDHYRVTRGGQPTWERVMRAAHVMRQAGTQFNGLCVVNELSAQHPEEIYEFYRRQGIRHMQFIPCTEPDPNHPDQLAAFSVTATAYGDFLCRLFDRWLKDFKNGTATTSIRWFDAVFHTYVDLPAPECTLLHECGCYLVVEHNGDVFACDFFVEPGWRLGNVLEGSLIEMLNSPRQNEFGLIKTALPEPCTQCEWLKHCHGGCPKDRQNGQRPDGLSAFCESYKMFFAHAHGRLDRIGTAWKKARHEMERARQRHRR